MSTCELEVPGTFAKLFVRAAAEKYDGTSDIIEPVTSMNPGPVVTFMAVSGRRLQKLLLVGPPGVYAMAWAYTR